MLFLLVGYSWPVVKSQLGSSEYWGLGSGVKCYWVPKTSSFIYIFVIGSGPLARVEGGVRADQVTLIEATIMT